MEETVSICIIKQTLSY